MNRRIPRPKQPPLEPTPQGSAGRRAGLPPRVVWGTQDAREARRAGRPRRIGSRVRPRHHGPNALNTVPTGDGSTTTTNASFPVAIAPLGPPPGGVFFHCGLLTDCRNRLALAFVATSARWSPPTMSARSSCGHRNQNSPGGNRIPTGVHYGRMTIIATNHACNEHARILEANANGMSVVALCPRAPYDSLLSRMESNWGFGVKSEQTSA